MTEKNMYQLVEDYGNHMHAGSKANSDVLLILKQLGFEEIIFQDIFYQRNFIKKIQRQLKFMFQWRDVYKNIRNDSILVLQHPFRARQIGRFKSLMNLKQKKNVKIISIVHDVEELRGLFKRDYYDTEFHQMLELADVLIIHNEKMKQWFIEVGVSAERLVVLEIFDYLGNKNFELSEEMSKVVNIAGNLSKEKSPYLYELSQIKNVSFTLYGINYNTEEQSENITYKGAFPAEQIPLELNDGFGLVWDGDSVDTCSGNTGNYLRYNNPHKLSLYLSSGIPVIVWGESAEAKFVKDYNVGYVVNSLKDIGSVFEMLNEEEYLEKKLNAMQVGERLKKGEYLKKAVEKALEYLNSIE